MASTAPNHITGKNPRNVSIRADPASPIPARLTITPPPTSSAIPIE
jgi:hypothetical protein